MKLFDAAGEVSPAAFVFVEANIDSLSFLGYKNNSRESPGPIPINPEKAMPLKMATTLSDCAKAIMEVYNTGELSDADKRRLEKGFDALMFLLRDLANKKPRFAEEVERAIDDVHTEVKYDRNLRILALADVAITVDRLRGERTRSQQIKVSEANALCIHLREELKDRVNGHG